MAFILLSDENGVQVECVVFPKVYDRYKSYLIKDTVIIIDGKLDARNDKPTIIVEKIKPVFNELVS